MIMPATKTPPGPDPDPAPEVDATLATMAEEAGPGPLTPAPEQAPEPGPQVYDERGNVRPHGTPGAKPMTKAQRVKIAKALAEGKTIVTTAEKKSSKADSA